MKRTNVKISLGVILLLACLAGKPARAVASGMFPTFLKSQAVSQAITFEDTTGCYRVVLPEGWNAVRSTLRGYQTFQKDEHGGWLTVECRDQRMTLDVLRKQIERANRDAFENNGITTTSVSERLIGAAGVKGLHVSRVRSNKIREERIYLLAAPVTVSIYFSSSRENDHDAFLRFLDGFELLVPADNLFVPPGPWPRTGPVSEYLGLQWDGQKQDEQCGWAADQFSMWYLGYRTPRTWPAGVERIWRMETPGFRKIPNTASAVPPSGALLLWDRRVGKGNGHIAVVLNAHPRNRWARVIDCNWNGNRRGRIHDVDLRDQRIPGWLVRE